MATRTSSKKAKPNAPRQSLWTQVRRHAKAQIRFVIAVVVGVAVALLAPLFLPIDQPVPRILAGWNAGGWLYFVLVVIKMWKAEIEGIKREAGIERESRTAVLLIVILGSVFAMLALFDQLMALKSEQGIDRTISISLSISTVFLSWFLIHTVFALYYAHEFHSESHGGARDTGGGLKFPDDSTPDYLDFLYFSFVVGTTAQTSDVDICSRAMRRVVMLHGILSFFFNTAVIALMVNLAAQLVQG
jgi:uncharacterized membrane protein